MIIKYKSFEENRNSDVWHYTNVGNGLTITRMLYCDEIDAYINHPAHWLADEKIEHPEGQKFALYYNVSYSNGHGERLGMDLFGYAYLLEDGKTIENLSAIPYKEEEKPNENN